MKYLIAMSLLLFVLLSACTIEATTTDPDPVVTPVDPVVTPVDPVDPVDPDPVVPDPVTSTLNTSLFFDNAFAEATTIEECTLTDGTVTQCYNITVAGTPSSHAVGPFCPPTINSTAEEGGLWLDGGELYVMDGQFIQNLATIYNDDAWKLYDDDGNVFIISTAEDFAAAARPDVGPEYKNYCVEGRMEWIDGGALTATVQIPVIPTVGDSVTTLDRDHADLGITLDGVLVSGTADVAAILAAYTIAAFDDCAGHINPALGYHIHGAGCSEHPDAVTSGETALFAYALDGYPIHSPLTGDDLTSTSLDQCNGHTTEELGYHYHANPVQDNDTLSCFTGLTVQGNDNGPPGRPPR